MITVEFNENEAQVVCIALQKVDPTGIFGTGEVIKKFNDALVEAKKSVQGEEKPKK